MTYNIHSCQGRDGRVSPERTAEVIRLYAPDIIALQEVRVGRDGREVDQPGVIGQLTRMTPLFYPLLRLEREDYGIALLSRFPIKLVRSALLPTLPDRPGLEPRGALWADVELDGGRVQVVTTHLGLNRAERLAQVDALMGPDWAGHPACRPPLILCGDLNAWPSQTAYKRLAGRFQDVQARHGFRGTFPGFFPLLRLDHIFLGPEARVLNVQVPSTRLTRRASDHLPIVADIAFGPTPPQ